MGLNKLGKFIEQIDIRNDDNKLGELDVRGLSTQKQIIETKADLRGVNLSSYKVFPPETFAFVPDTSRRGDKISLAYNRDGKAYLVSSISVIFRVNKPDEIDPEYLFMFFNRPEFDRYARFNSWGSTREPFSWDDMCDIDIDLPSLSVQKKYAAIYNSMLTNQKSYERGLDDMKLVCDAYIEALRRDMGTEAIGPFIKPCDERNSDLEIKLAQGITIDKEFSTPKQVAAAERSAKIVRTGQFAYNRATTRNGDKISIAYRYGQDCVVSSAYQVFEIKDKEKLLPEYLMMWFKRSEFDRYARYMSKGSAHEFFEYEDMEEVMIPIPDINKQKAISDIYTAYLDRRLINEKLKAQIKDLCPILIKGSLEESAS